MNTNVIPKKPVAQTTGFKPFRQKYDIVLSSESSALSASSSSQKVLSIRNDRSKSIRVTSISLIYKTGLEDALIEIKRSGANGELVAGQTHMSVIGRDRSKDKTLDFPVDFLLGDTLEIELWIKTKSIAVAAGDVCMAVLGEYI